MKPSKNPWFSFREPSRTASVRLFCLPYAGGSGSAYYSWLDRLGPRVEVCPLELPGRAARLREPPFLDLRQLVSALTAALEPYLDRPYALFGYSMGALVAFELTRSLCARGAPSPERLFVAARAAPRLAPSSVRLAQLADDAFLEEVQRRYRAIPPLLLDDADTRRAIVRVLRADLALVESHTPSEPARVPVPLMALGGTADAGVPARALYAWAEHTEAEFSRRLFEGDHFFLETQREALLHCLQRELSRSSPHQRRLRSGSA